MRQGNIRSMRELSERLAQLRDLEPRYRQVIRNDFKRIGDVVRHPFRFLFDRLKSAAGDRGGRSGLLRFAVENGARLLLRSVAKKPGAALVTRLLTKLKII